MRIKDLPYLKSDEQVCRWTLLNIFKNVILGFLCRDLVEVECNHGSDLICASTFQFFGNGAWRPPNPWCFSSFDSICGRSCGRTCTGHEVAEIDCPTASRTTVEQEAYLCRKRHFEVPEKSWDGTGNALKILTLSHWMRASCHAEHCMTRWGKKN